MSFSNFQSQFADAHALHQQWFAEDGILHRPRGSSAIETTISGEWMPEDPTESLVGGRHTRLRGVLRIDSAIETHQDDVFVIRGRTYEVETINNDQADGSYSVHLATIEGNYRRGSRERS